MEKVFVLFLLFSSAGFLHAQEWEHDFDSARQIATENHHKIIMVFSGSDWCAPCIKLDQQIWSTDTFQSYAHDNYVMLKVDFPRKKKNQLDPVQQEKNNHLAEQYNRQGYFPYVVVMDAEGRVLGATGYQDTTPEGYIAILNGIGE